MQKVIGAVAVVLGVLAGWFLIVLLNPWNVFKVGEFTVRQNRLSGVAELQVGDRWTRFQDDLYAPAVPPEYVSRIRIDDPTWGPDGVLVAKAYNRLAEPVKGRLAIRIVFRNAKDKRFMRDRSLRATVDFPPMQSTPFVIQTDLTSPDPKTTLTEIELQPTSASGL